MLFERFNTSIFITKDHDIVREKLLYINPISADSHYDKGLSGAYVEHFGKLYLKHLTESKLDTKGDHTIWQLSTEKDDLLTPPPIQILTIVTKKTGKCISETKDIESIMKDISKILKDVDDDTLVITPLIGCGLGQLTYFDAKPITQKHLGHCKQNIILSMHPHNKPKNRIPQWLVATDGNDIPFKDRDVIFACYSNADLEDGTPQPHVIILEDDHKDFIKHMKSFNSEITHKLDSLVLSPGTALKEAILSDITHLFLFRKGFSKESQKLMNLMKPHLSLDCETTFFTYFEKKR